LLAGLTLVASAYCAKGGEEDHSVSSTIDWTTAASGGGGMGGQPVGAAGSGAQAGGGGQPSAAGGTGGTGGGGGMSTAVLVMLAGSDSSPLAAVFRPNQGWSSAPLAGSTVDRPAIATLADGSAIALVREAATDKLRYTQWNQSSWSALNDVSALVTTRSAPSLAQSGATAHAVYHGLNYMHYYAAYGTQWAPTDEPVAPINQPQSFGPTAASVATVGSDVVVAFAGSDTELYVQERTGGVWGMAAPIAASHISHSPAIVELTSAPPELMIVYVNHQPSQFDDKKLFWTTRTGGTWSTPQKIDDAVFTDEPIRLASLPNGQAIVSYRGSNGQGYWLRYDDTTMPPWSVAAPIGNPNPNVVSAPDVAAGIDGADAELVYVNTQDGSAYHARLMGTTWSAAAVVGGTALDHVAIDIVP
jgi:hypothetical protein